MTESSAGDESRLFEALCALSAEAQAAHLAALAHAQPALAQRLRRLLDIDAQYAAHTACAAGVALADAVALAVESSTDAPAGPNDGDKTGSGIEVGPYRLLRRIGRGGMGVVHLAERRSGFVQQVAIKLLPRFAADTQARARFARERQLLAQLQHPHICGIFDGGELDDGTPWLAMELVQGESLCAWCARRALPLRERVTLFLQLCDAVQYAHRRLVVHRDIKDGNVLVDEDGRARLLDFGIAKALDGEVGDAEQTQAQDRYFSPLSAAPEQLRGAATGTAVDIHALGALLHQLLAGALPFAEIARDRMALQTAILERVPAPASVALQRAQDEGRVGRAHPVAVRSLRGDLDAVIARCLRKDPDERYADVADLARDLRAWLDGRPVSVAAGDRWGDRLYRLRKFVVRHRSATMLGALAMASLVFAFAATLWRSAELRAERDAAQAARAQSDIDRDRARAVAGFMRETFEQADPGRATEGGLLARDLITQGLQRLGRLDAQPDVQAELALLLAESQQALGLERESRALVVDHARAIERIARDDPALSWRLARLRAAHAVVLDTDAESVETTLRIVAALADTPQQKVELARLQERLAVRFSRSEDAVQLLEAAWAAHAEALAPDSRLALRLDLAWALQNAKRNEDALRLLEGLDHDSLAPHLPALQIRAWRVLARALKLRLDAQGGDRAALDRALQAWQQAAERLYGPDSLEMASALVWSIGAEPEPATQQRLLQRAYTIQRERLPANTLARARAEYNAGYYWLALRDDPARAEPHLAQSVASGRAAASRAHSDVRRFEVSWAQALNALGRHAQVLQVLAAPPEVEADATTGADAATEVKHRDRLLRELATAASRSGSVPIRGAGRPAGRASSDER